MTKTETDNQNNFKLLFFKPYLKEVIWAGAHLQKHFQTPKPVGEAWILSAYPDKQSICTNENIQLKNKGLKEIFEQFPNLFGNKYSLYPNLTKIIDTALPLSVQVHPNNEAAKKYHSLGKEECWYVLKNDHQQQFILGYQAESLQAAKQMILNKAFDALLQKHVVEENDFIYIPPGTIHALPSEVTVFELQQSSDLTFRIYDYDRLDHDNQLRALHTYEAIDVLEDSNYFIKQKPKKELVNNHLFHLQLIECNEKTTNQKLHLQFLDNLWTEFTVIEGQGWVDGILIQKYNSFILTHQKNNIIISGNLKILVNSVK